MSFRPNQSQQLTLTDSFLQLSKRSQKVLLNSWCKDFAEIVFPAINEKRFKVLYSDNDATRPNTPTNTIIAALIIKELLCLSDDELLESIHCDIRFQYALHTTHLEEQPFSDRTFSRFRERNYQYELETGTNLLEQEINHLTEVFAKYMKLASNIKRMDSLMIASRCKRMTRLEIVYSTTASALNLLHRLGTDESIPCELLHYLDEDDYNKVIYHCKGDETESKFERAIREAQLTKELMSDDSWHEFSEYQLLVRVLEDQTKKDENGSVAIKDGKQISSSSLQNPTDPDATYRSKGGKSHKGYVGNIIETIGEDGDSLITGGAFEQNIHSDSDFCKEYLESRPVEVETVTMITDGAYGGAKNQELAENKNTRLVTTTLTGKAANPIFAEFRLTENGQQVIKCPMGNKPEKTTYNRKNGQCRVIMRTNHCKDCPHKESCKAKKQNKNYVVQVSENMVHRARYQKQLSTDEYIRLTRMRNAVEGIPSVMRRRYHIDSIPVFGKLRSKQFFWMKIGAYNFKKLLRHNRRSREECAQNLKMA
jgi:hypothetical protein